LDINRAAVFGMNLPCRIEPDRLILFVRLTPKGGQDGVDGIETGADGKAYLKVRVRAVPEDGKANAALVALLTKQAGVPRLGVSVAAGHASRLKQVKIKGDAQAILTLLFG
jgi:uncharacterized protein